MTEQYLPNTFRDVTSAFAQGQQLGREDKLRGLAPGVFSGSAEATQQAYALDPDEAKKLVGGADRIGLQVNNIAKQIKQYVDAGKPELAAALYSQALPTLKPRFPNAPNEFGPDVMTAVEAVIAQTEYLTKDDGVGSRVQSTQIDNDGNIWTVDRSGKWTNSGIKASPTGTLVNTPGQAPYTVTTGRGQIGAANQVMPGGAPQQGAPQVAPMQQGPTPPLAPNGANYAPQEDDQIGIIEQEIGRPLTQQERQQIAQGKFSLQVPSGQPQAPGIPPQPQAGGWQVPITPSKAEDARSVEEAKNQVQLGYLPELERIKRESAIAQAGGVEEVKSGVKLAAETNKRKSERSRDANDVLGFLDQAEALIPLSTGSGAGALADKALGFVGVADQGAQAIASLGTIAGQLVAKMPRMEGPQSDKDVNMYKDMAGNLSDPTLPRESRMAALKEVRRLNEKYAGRQQSGPVRIKSAADYNALPSGAEFIAPDGTLRRKR